MRSRPNSHVMEMLRRHENQIATATIVWHELLFGCNRLPDSKKRQTIERYLKEVVEPKYPHTAIRCQLSDMARSRKSSITIYGKDAATQLIGVYSGSRLQEIEKSQVTTIVSHPRTIQALPKLK